MKNIETLILLLEKVQDDYTKLVMAELKENGINDLILSQIEILSVLYEHDGALPMEKIAELIGKHKSTIPYLVNKLVNSGYVTKDYNYWDSRKKYITLSDKSKFIENKLKKISENVLSIIYDDFTKEERENMMEYLDKMNENFDEVLRG
jgi:DNA-binding MarR family transcriptional regulator